MPGSIIVENDYYGKGLALGFCNHWFALGVSRAPTTASAMVTTAMTSASMTAARPRG